MTRSPSGPARPTSTSPNTATVRPRRSRSPSRATTPASSTCTTDERSVLLLRLSRSKKADNGARFVVELTAGPACLDEVNPGDAGAPVDSESPQAEAVVRHDKPLGQPESTDRLSGTD